MMKLATAVSEVDLFPLIRELSPAVVQAIADRCDGHSDLSIEECVSAGLPIEVAKHLADEHGVFGASLLELIAKALGVTYEDASGHNRRAQNIKAAMKGMIHIPLPAPTQEDWSIAHDYGVSIDEVRERNRLSAIAEANGECPF